MSTDTGLQLNQSALQKVLGGVGDGFILTDNTGCIQYMNKAAEEIFSVDFANISKRMFSEVCKLLNVETLEKFYNPVEKAMREKKTVGLSRNIGVMTPEGPEYLSATCSPMLNEDSKVIGCTAIFRNISRIRNLEQKVVSDQYYMRAVFEAAKIGICSMDVNARLVEVNEAALETMGITYQEAIGNKLGDMFSCVNAAARGCGNSAKCQFCVIRNNVEAALLDDSFSTEFIAAIISTKNEEPIWLQFFLTQVWKDNVKQVVLTLIDISKRKQRERELTEAKRVAEAASLTKTQFLANMSHEIRTPINGMTGMINLTLRTDLSELQRENLQAAKQCSEDLLRIINDILDYSKLESGKMPIENIDMDLPAMLDRVRAVHAQVAKEKGLEFNYLNSGDLPKYIKGDPLRLRQILHNLLTNAVKFTMQGSITLGARTFERGVGQYMEFLVEDTGIGMSPEEQEKLFKPFSQVDGSITRRFGGTGLGLMIVRELLKAMNGEIRVDSTPGKGSRFIFSIPLVLAQKADKELKDQTVFLNPHRPGCVENQNVFAMGDNLSGFVSVEDDDEADVLDLLKYCEDRLQN